MDFDGWPVILYLTNDVGYIIIIMKYYSTIQVARFLKIGSGTFHRWIREGRVKAPPLQLLGGMKVRLWTEKDVEKVRKFKVERYWGKGSHKITRKSKKRRK